MFLGSGAPGPSNAITDVQGVRVGQFTLRDDSRRIATGVTAVAPHEGNAFRERVPIGVHTINGFGKAAGFEQARELGLLETPILLTTTLCVGRASDTLVGWMMGRTPELKSVNPVVGECNDWRLNGNGTRSLKEEYFVAALDAAYASPAGKPVEEGTVGAGTGMRGFGFKGGVGTASRVLAREQGGFTVGAIVVLNCGGRSELCLCGVPAGRLLPGAANAGPKGGRARKQGGEGASFAQGGSIMIVLATDAPADSRQLTRIARRGAFGLARTGAGAGHGSGDFVIAFSTGARTPRDPKAKIRTTLVLNEDNPLMDSMFRAAAETVEEAIVNALCAAVAIPGTDAPELPREETIAVLRQRGLFR